MGRKRRHLNLVSPIAIVGLGQLVARGAGPMLGLRAWVWLFLGYWATLAALIALSGGKKTLTRWLRPSQGSRLWPLLAVAFALLSTLWMFVPNWRLLLHSQVLLLTIPFALINPCLEEGYWRGLIIDAAAHWPRWLVALYTSVFSAVNHMWLMVVVAAARNPAVPAYQFALGLLMAVVYLETGSLRWPIAAHALVNLLSLTVAMFLNLYVPGPPT